MIRNSHVSFSFNEILDKDKYAVQSLDSKDRSEGESRITNYVKALITEKDLSSTLVAMMSLLFKQSILVDPSKPCRSDLFIISQEKIQLGIKLEFLEEN